jgi:DNA-binding MarR family transcriptional regulator
MIRSQTTHPPDFSLGDSIDRVMAGWQAERPDLDVSAIAVTARLARLRSEIDQRLDVVFRSHGLRGADFAVLATLVRLAESAVPQKRLMAELKLSAGTLSVRIDNLERRGLVSRERDPADGRGTLVALTNRGREAFEASAPEHLANARDLLLGLDQDERDQLAALLAKLLGSLEDPGPDDELALELGMVLAPPAVATEMRRAVGLPGRLGLLVRHVDPTGPAAAAGVRQGDLITAAGGQRLRSHRDLVHLIRRTGKECDLGVVRGIEELQITITVPKGAAPT